jgi:hypothetical protein
MKKLRSRFELAFGLAFYVALAGFLFDVIGNREVRPPGYPEQTWFLLHSYPISVIWQVSLFVGAALLFVVLPAALIYFILRGARRRNAGVDRALSSDG